LLLRNPAFDVVRVQDVGLLGADDEQILAWAANCGRIVITHDSATLADLAYERMRKSRAMPGVLLVDDRAPLGISIDDLLLINACDDTAEWRDRVVRVPLQ
jgi:hypothetical protein